MVPTSASGIACERLPSQPRKQPLRLLLSHKYGKQVLVDLPRQRRKQRHLTVVLILHPLQKSLDGITGPVADICQVGRLALGEHREQQG